MEYTNKEAIENYIVRTIDPAFDTQISQWIKAISMNIDAFCGRTIALIPTESNDMVSTASYDGDGTDTILIKDCTGISEVKVDAVSIPIYYRYPANKSYSNKIKLPDSCFTKGNLNVEVTGIQAMFTSVPEDIKLACTILVGIICNNQVNKDKGMTERIGNYSITYTDAQAGDMALAKSILNSYKVISV